MMGEHERYRYRHAACWIGASGTESCQDWGDRPCKRREVVVGKTQVIQTAIASLLAGGHVLLEDAPGVAKTVLVKALAKSLGLTFKRVQCTPDLLPTDVNRRVDLQPEDHGFRVSPRPRLCHLLLVDELNRATPRTQFRSSRMYGGGPNYSRRSHVCFAKAFHRFRDPESI